MTIKHIFLSAGIAALLGSSALAGGIASGTSVANSIDLSYDIGGGTISRPDEASDTFSVDRRVDFDILGRSSITVEQGAANQMLSFVLSNDGNDPTPFDLDVVVSDDGDPIGLSYDPTGSGVAGTWSFYISSTGAGVGTLYTPSGIVSTGMIAPDDVIYATVVAHIPDDATEGQKDIFTVTARPLNDAGTAYLAEITGAGAGGLDITFADAGTDGTESDGKSQTVIAPMLTATKSADVASENIDGSFNCASDAPDAGAMNFLPGACVSYTITLTNDAAAGLSATNLTFTDTLPANVTLEGVYSNSGFDSVTTGAGTVSATVTALDAGETATLVILRIPR